MEGQINSRERIKQRVESAVQTKLTGIGLKSDKAGRLAPIITDLMAEGKTKTEVNDTLKTLIGEDYYKPSFTDWLFGYANFFISNNHKQEAIPSPTQSENEEYIDSSDEEKDEPISPPATPAHDAVKSTQQKNTLVKRRLSRSASSLDLASEVQKEVYGQAMAIAATTESLNKVQISEPQDASPKILEKKKSFSRISRRESFMSNHSHASSEDGEKPHVVRCSYWPNCNRGDACKFWHPKELCRRYPHCPDGDHCLYIHPAPLTKPPVKPQSPNPTTYAHSHTSETASNAGTSNTSTIECKFGANCNRPDCKFSHPSPAAVAAMMAAKQQQATSNHIHTKPVQTEESSNMINIPCRYEPNCTRADCKFLHTKPRKF